MADDFVIGDDGIPEPVLKTETPVVVAPKKNGAETVVAKTVDAAADTSAEEGVEDLRKQLADRSAELDRERNARKQAESQARENEQRAVRHEAAASNSRVGQITAAIEAREAAKASAKKSYAEALAAGDFEKTADAQEKLGELAAEIVSLKRDKQSVEIESRRAIEQAQSSPVERYIGQNRISSPSAAWLRSHPDAVNNPRRLAAADAAAQEIEGLKPDSPEYFAHLEKVLGYSKAAPERTAEVGDHAAPENPRQRQEPADRNISVSAPPSRKSPSTSRQTKVEMTPEMKHHAEISGLSDEEYARNWLAAKNEGKLIAH